MATNFGPEATQAPEIQSATTVKEGQVKEPAFLQGLTDVFEQAGGILKARKSSREESLISDYTRQQTLLADAVDQGTLTLSAARTRSRKLFLQGIEANPGVADKLIAAHRAVIGTPGLGKVLDEGTKEQQRWDSRKDQLSTAGLVPADASEDAFREADEAARVAVAAQERYDERMNTLNLKQKQLTVGSTAYEANQRQITEENRKFLIDTQPVRFTQTKSAFANIVNGAGTAAEKQRAIEDLYTSQLSQASARLGSLSGQESKYLLLPFEQLRDQYIARATGELEDAEMERNIERIQNTSQLMLMQDPVVANMVATSKMIGDNALLEIALRNNKVWDRMSNLIAGNTEGSTTEPPSLYSTDPSQKEAVKGYTDASTRNLLSNDEDTRTEAEHHVSRILESLVDDEGKIRRDPKAAFQPVKWVASSEFYKARTERADVFAGEMDGVREVLTAHYGDEVWGMVNREFLQANVVTPGEIEGFQAGMMGGVSEIRGESTVTPSPEAVGYRSTSSGVEFFALDAENTQAVGEAARLNKNLKPIINETVRAFAHMDGRNDYGAYWGEISEQFFQGQGTPEAAGGDEGDDLSLENFNQSGSALTSAMSDGGFVGSGDFTNAETPIEVAAAFTGFEETEHKNVLSNFIKNTFGTNLDPSETAWCAAFVNAALGAKGQEGTGKLNAKSFLNWGESVDEPKQGDIAVFDRGAPGSWQGHVGFYVGPSEKKGHVKILGGNQNNKVSIKDYPVDRLEGFRRG